LRAAGVHEKSELQFFQARWCDCSCERKFGVGFRGGLLCFFLLAEAKERKIYQALSRSTSSQTQQVLKTCRVVKFKKRQRNSLALHKTISD